MKKLSKTKFNRMVFMCNTSSCKKISTASQLRPYAGRSNSRIEPNEMLCRCGGNSAIEIGTFNTVYEIDGKLFLKEWPT